ncbi:MAG: DUF881 domain-containing protein [Clostridia bacterium]
MRRSKYAIALTCMLLAIVVTLQAKSVMQNKEVTTSNSIARAESLQISLLEEQQKTSDLYEQLELYRDEIELYSKAASEAGGYSQILNEQLSQAQIVAGLTDVQGPGVTVTMKDSETVNVSGLDENNFIIHDEDILRVINVLRDSGAEAISLNGERIIATSEISCSGSTVSVNNTRYSAPYVIKAIGSAVDMAGALEMRQGVVDILGQWGIEISVKQESNIIIEAFDGIISNKYITTIKDEG